MISPEFRRRLAIQYLSNNKTEDRISTLPDELLHYILSFVESNVAAQTCVLSKRWVNLWSTLPFLNFEPSHFGKYDFYYRNFVNDLFSYRNPQSDTSSIKIDLRGFDEVVTKQIVDYAISHRVKKFHIIRANLTSQFSFPLLTDLSLSKSTALRDLSFPVLKTLHLSSCRVAFMDWSMVSLITLRIENVIFLGDNREQNFPILKSLHLSHCQVFLMHWSLPSLINMHLRNVTCLGEERVLNFAVLKTLHLSDCSVPIWDWRLPVLSTLYLDSVHSRLYGFDGFNQLKSITMVRCPELSDMDVSIVTSTATSLTISQCCSVMPPTCNFVIVAPNLSFFKFQGNCVPTFPTEGCLSRLTEVNFNIDIGKYDWKGYNPEKRKQVIQQLISMFRAFQEIEFLILSFTTIKVLSRFSDFSEYLPSPFGKLKSLKVLGSMPESEPLVEFPDHILRYLLSSSPGARIFIKDHYRVLRNYDPKTNMLIWSSSGYRFAQKSEEDTTSDTKSVVSNNLPSHEQVEKKRKACPQGQNATSNVQNNGDGLDRVLGVIPSDLLHRAVNDEACSYSKNSSFSLWEGHQVYLEYVDLLTRIKEKHPETFEHFTPRTNIMYTLGLNTFCSTVKSFSEETSSSFTDSNSSSYKDLFADLERWGFNITWLVNHLSDGDILVL